MLERPPGEDGVIEIPAELTRRMRMPAIELAVDDDTGAGAGTDRKADDAGGAAPGPKSPFAHRGEVAPVFDDDGHVKMLSQSRPQWHVAPAEPERQHHLTLRLLDDRGQANANTANGLAARAAGRHQSADQADKPFEVAPTIIVGRLVHFGLHDVLEIADGAVELTLPRLNADDRMRRSAKLDARPRSASRRLIEPIIGNQIFGDQILYHAHHSRQADIEPLREA